MYYERLLKRKKKIYLHPDELLKDAVDYFKWVDNHPLLEEKSFQFQGVIVKDDLAKMRPYTKTGLAAHLGMTVSRLNGFKSRGEEWAEVVAMIEEVIYTQKFEGAAAGLLNASIIGRDLGLAEKQESKVEATGGGGAPLPVFNLVPIQSGTFLEPPEQQPEAKPPTE